MARYQRLGDLSRHNELLAQSQFVFRVGEWEKGYINLYCFVSICSEPKLIELKDGPRLIHHD